MNNISKTEYENRISSVRSNRDRSAIVNLKKEILDTLQNGDFVTAKGAIEELFVIAASYETYILETPSAGQFLATRK